MVVKSGKEVLLMAVAIRENHSGAVLALAEIGSGAIKHDGNWYFNPEAVDREALRVTARTYTCPVKGTCYWVDYVAPDGRVVPDVAWVYDDPKSGHEVIKGRYGFYGSTQGGTHVDVDV